jgi:hypothetical protein
MINLLPLLRELRKKDSMILRIFKSMWFLSLLAALASLLFVYASWPEQVVVQEQAAKLLSLPKDTVFYIAIGMMAITNVLVYIVAKLFHDDQFKSWFYGLIITLNIFFIVALKMLGTFNSGENFNYSRIDFIIYGSVLLILFWAISWPFYSVYRKFFHKPTV